MPALEGYGSGKNRMYRTTTKRQGGRFGGEQEQRQGKASRGGMKKSSPRLTLPDYDNAKV